MGDRLALQLRSPPQVWAVCLGFESCHDSVAPSEQPGSRVACFGKPVLVQWGHRAYLTRIWHTSTLPPLLAALQGPCGAAGRSTAAVVGPAVPPPERVGRSGTFFSLAKHRERPPVAHSSPRPYPGLGLRYRGVGRRMETESTLTSTPCLVTNLC